MKESYTLEEILAATKGAYGHETFAGIVCANARANGEGVAG